MTLPDVLHSGVTQIPAHLPVPLLTRTQNNPDLWPPPRSCTQLTPSRCPAGQTGCNPDPLAPSSPQHHLGEGGNVEKKVLPLTHSQNRPRMLLTLFGTEPGCWGGEAREPAGDTARCSLRTIAFFVLQRPDLYSSLPRQETDEATD